MVATTHIGPCPDIDFDRDFLRGIHEPNKVEEIRQLICELQARVSIRDAELSEIQSVLAGTSNA